MWRAGSRSPSHPILPGSPRRSFSAPWVRRLYALGVSAGIMIAYGAYMSAGESLGRVVLAVVGSIFAVSLLATVAIFPLVFHYGLDPAGGPQLVFEVLPVAFAEMPEGGSSARCFSRCSFSPRSLRRWGCWSRGSRGWSSALECGGRSRRAHHGFMLAGRQGSVLSFGRWATWHPLPWIPRFASFDFFGLMDFVSANLLMPMSALLVSVFVGGG